MKKIIKLLVLIFLLTSCNSVKEIELNDEKTNTSIDQSKKSNSTNTLAKSDEDKVEDDADSSKDEDSNKKNNSLDDKNKDGKKTNTKVNDKEEPKNNNSNKNNNQDKKPEVRDDKNSNQNVDKPKDTKTSGETNDSKPIEKPKDTKEPKEEKKPQEQKTLEEKKPEDADITEGLEPNRIYYDGSSVGYLDLGIDNYNIDVTQKYIDDGNVIATVTKFNPKDSEITYFSGHTYNYNNVSRLQLSSLVTITDANGVGYNYRIVDFKKYPAGLVEEDAPFIGGYHLIDLAGEGIGKESIVIQYCDEEDVPMIFFGLPE